MISTKAADHTPCHGAGVGSSLRKEWLPGGFLQRLDLSDPGIELHTRQILPGFATQLDGDQLSEWRIEPIQAELLFAEL